MTDSSDPDGRGPLRDDTEPGHPNHELLELVTERLILREITQNDLATLIPVYQSHTAPEVESDPAYVLKRLTHEWRVLETLGTHHTLALFERQNMTTGDGPLPVTEFSGEPVGVLDYMDESPQAHIPWLGLVMVRADHLGHGIAGETLETLFAYGESLGWTRIGTGVPESDRDAFSFLAHFGFHEAGRSDGPIPGQPDGTLLILERTLGH